MRGRRRACAPGRSLALVLALLGLLSAAPRMRAQQSGLLLGFADADSASMLWLTRSEGRFRLLRLPGMYVPRADGLWRIGTDTVRVQLPREAEDSGRAAPADSVGQTHALLAGLWLARVGEKPVLAPADTQLIHDYMRSRSYAGGTRRKLALTFVGPEYISIDDHLVVEGVFANADRSIGRLDTLAATGYAYHTSELSGSSLGGYPSDPHATADFLKLHREWCMKRASPSWWQADGPLQPAESWGIVRGQGYWRYVRRFSMSQWVYNAFEYDCRVPFLPPASIVGSDELRPAWSVVSTRVPDARDAFTSPDGQYIVVLTKDELRVHRVSGPRMGSLMLRTAAPGLPVVQVRWATGEDVARWSRDLTAVAPAGTQAQQLEVQRAPARRSQPSARRRHHAKGRSSSH